MPQRTLVLGAEPQVLDCRSQEQLGQGQRSSELLFDPRCQTDREQRVSAQVEEVIGHADRADLEQVFPDRRKLCLDLVARTDMLLGRRNVIGQRFRKV